MATNNPQIIERSHATGNLYGIGLALGNRRVHIVLGHQRDGWTRELADTALRAVTAVSRAQRTVRCSQRRRQERG